jgi:hypothetical protein
LFTAHYQSCSTREGNSRGVFIVLLNERTILRN